MLTIKDLGKEIKSRNPGLYDHLTDEQVGRAKKRSSEAKGSHEFDNYQEVGIVTAPKHEIYNEPEKNNQPRQLVKRETDKLAPLNEKIQSSVEFLENKIKPNKNWFTSYFQKIRSLRNIDLIKIVTENQKAFIEQGAVLEQAARQNSRDAAAYEFFVAQNQQILYELQAKEYLLQDAIDTKLPIEEYVEYRKQELLTELEIKKYLATEGVKDFNQVKKEQEMSKIKLDEYREKAKIDLDNEVELAQQELRLQIIADHLTHQQEMTLIQDSIEDQYVKIDNTKTSKFIPEGAKQDIISSRMRIIGACKTNCVTAFLQIRS